jgi:hypothetical protein
MKYGKSYTIFGEIGNKVVEFYTMIIYLLQSNLQAKIFEPLTNNLLDQKADLKNLLIRYNILTLILEITYLSSLVEVHACY